MTPSDSAQPTPITTFSFLPRALLAASCSHFTLYLRYHSFNVLSALRCFGQHHKRVPRLSIWPKGKQMGVETVERIPLKCLDLLQRKGNRRYYHLSLEYRSANSRRPRKLQIKDSALKFEDCLRSFPVLLIWKKISTMLASSQRQVTFGVLL
jgi:hypothetical protein